MHLIDHHLSCRERMARFLAVPYECLPDVRLLRRSLPHCYVPLQWIRLVIQPRLCCAVTNEADVAGIHFGCAFDHQYRHQVSYVLLIGCPLGEIDL